MPDTPTNADKATYRAQKLSGGGSGRGGVKYEARASTWLTVPLAFDVAKGSRKAADIVIGTQTADFVNDIVLNDGIVRHRGEMKSGQSVEMKTGDFKSLRWDFVEQMTNDATNGSASRYYLFVADEKVRTRVAEEAPEGVQIVTFPNSTKPSVIEKNVESFCSWLFRLLPQREMAESNNIYKNGRAYIRILDYNDTNNVYQWFIQSFDALNNNSIEHFDIFLNRVSRASNGLLAFGPRELRTDVKEKLAKIDGIEVVSCEGRVFYRLENGVCGHLSAALEEPAGMMFEDFLMSADVFDCQGVLEVFEHVEALCS